jgi:CHAT domain-containing protein
MLPLHAAGHHTADGGLTVYDRVVSSYTPTLRALAHARRPSTTATAEGGLLVIAMPETPGHARLPGADEERRTLAGLLDGARRTELVDHLATRTAIITELPRHRWLHASCHGTQDLAAPAEGGLVPYDWQTAGLVGIGDLTDTAQVGGEFAFLSACKTATGGVANLDEAISIATAMQYAGWRHVIGTQWAVGDQIAVTVTDGVYPQLVRHGELDPTRAAQALHHTIRGLREQQPDRPSAWVPFIHIGP